MYLSIYLQYLSIYVSVNLYTVCVCGAAEAAGWLISRAKDEGLSSSRPAPVWARWPLRQEKLELIDVHVGKVSLPSTAQMHYDLIQCRKSQHFSDMAHSKMIPIMFHNTSTSFELRCAETEWLILSFITWLKYYSDLILLLGNENLCGC